MSIEVIDETVHIENGIVQGLINVLLGNLQIESPVATAGLSDGIFPLDHTDNLLEIPKPNNILFAIGELDRLFFCIGVDIKIHRWYVIHSPGDAGILEMIEEMGILDAVLGPLNDPG